MGNLVKSDVFGKQDYYSKPVDLGQEYLRQGMDLPKSVIINHGEVIDAVSFSYKEGDLPLIGGKGGSKESFTLAPGEYVIKVSGGYTSNYYGASALTSLYFMTNKGHVLGAHTARPDEGRFTYEVPAGMAICCLFGSRSEHTDGSVFTASIGFYSKKVEVAPQDFYEISIPAGPLWSHEDALRRAPFICAAHGGTFTGCWQTVIWGKMSAVVCKVPYPAGKNVSFKMDVPAGPIWSNEDAKEKCEAICASYGGKWTGQWRTIVEGAMSVCECEFNW
jgi:Mannan-binding protein/Jacalin-like lectin domain